MRSPTRTNPGKLHEGRSNAREAAVLSAFAKQISTVLWDFTADGGAVGTISFNSKLPKDAVVTAVWTDEETPVVGATSITLNADGVALTGALNLTASAGVNSQTLAGSATGIKLAADAELNIAIATTPATAGRVRFCVSWYLSPA